MSDNRDKLQEEIKVQGELVRKVKAAKEPKAKVSCRDSDAIRLQYDSIGSLQGLSLISHRQCKSLQTIPIDEILDFIQIN